MYFNLSRRLLGKFARCLPVEYRHALGLGDGIRPVKKRKCYKVLQMQYKLWPNGEGHPKHKLRYLYCVLSQKLSTLCLKNNLTILTQIVQETQKWHWTFSRPSSSWVIDQNMQNIVLINNSRTALSTKILMSFEFLRKFASGWFSKIKSFDNFEIAQ